MVPEPHSTEHFDHSPQSLVLQSIAANQHKIIKNIRHNINNVRQGVAAQFSASIRAGHPRPPGPCGCVILRLRLREPPPHLVEQSDHDDHSDTRQSLELRAAEKQIMKWS